VRLFRPKVPMPEHDRRTVQDLAEQLADWTRDEGSKGKLFDGVSNNPGR
jgi:hypothetical protein